MAVGVALLIGVAVTVGAGLLLYLAVRAESDRRERMSRSAAERVARRDTPDPGNSADRDRGSR